MGKFCWLGRGLDSFEACDVGLRGTIAADWCQWIVLVRNEVLEEKVERMRRSEARLRRIGIIKLGVLSPIINTDQFCVHHCSVIEDERRARSLPNNVASRPCPGLERAQSGVIDEVKEPHDVSLICISQVNLES